MLLKGTVRSYDSGAGTAEVEIAGSHGGYITVPVATHLDSRSMVVGLRCALLCFDPQDQGDAVLVATYDEEPLMGAATLDHDHTGDAGDGGQLTAAAIDSDTAETGHVLAADGAGGAAFESPLANLAYGETAGKYLKSDGDNSASFVTFPDHDHGGDEGGDGGALTGYIPTTKEDNGCRLYNSGAQTIGNSSWTALTFDSEAYDTDGMHSTSTNTSRATCVTAGKYVIHGQITFAANATGSRWVAIKKNGAFFANESRLNAGSGSVVVFTVNMVIDLAEADYVELFVIQNSGGDLAVNGGNTVTALAVQRLV